MIGHIIKNYINIIHSSVVKDSTVDVGLCSCFIRVQGRQLLLETLVRSYPPSTGIFRVVVCAIQVYGVAV